MIGGAMTEPVATPDAAASLARAQQAMAGAGVDALLVGPGADLRYLVGYQALELERLTLLVARADGRHSLVVPRLERPRAERSGAAAAGVELVDFAETDDPFRIVAQRLSGLGDRPRLG